MLENFRKKIKDVYEDKKMYYGFGISKTLSGFTNEINKLLVDREFFDDNFFDDFEEKLIEMDILPNLALIISDNLKKKIYNERVKKDDFEKKLEEVILDCVNIKEEKLNINPNKINAWLVIGVNGVGKTTSISKLVHKHRDKNILLGAADTFRAGAIDQINEWANKLNVDIVKTHQGHAPSAVVYETIDKAIKEDRELVICDTAGRLHNKENLMKELEKIHKIIVDKTNNDVELKTILVLDGTAGKNTLQQAKSFNEITKIDGLIITKLDSGGKAGMIINISYDLDIPIYYLTNGEKVENLIEFDKSEYIKGLFLENEN